MSLEAIKYKNGKLEIIDQLLLPFETKYIDVKDTEDGWKAIHDMQVRGAPAIAVVGVLSLVSEIYEKKFTSVDELSDYIEKKLHFLVTARPTAVNMADARDKLVQAIKDLKGQEALTPEQAKTQLISLMEKIQKDDIATNVKMGEHGANSIVELCGEKRPLTILTHCNTGSLATAGFGTALGVVRMLHERKLLARCYYTETRPYNQGGRLTGYELIHDHIPSTLICDNMVAALMSRRGISAVVTGADRVAANGDTANKIGTCGIAIIAKHYGVPFYIVAPSTSVDLGIESGDKIVIEERPPEEITKIRGVTIAAAGTVCWNPAFDVTPAELITGGIVTEFGVFPPQLLKQSLQEAKNKAH